MAKQFLTIEDHLLMLNEYAPHKVAMKGAVPPLFGNREYVLVGVDFGLNYAIVATDGAWSYHSPSEVQPVLYSLADLPNLSSDRHRASPVATFIHALAFIDRGDYGSGEWVNQVTVKSASEAQLHLAFSTIYQPDTSQWSDEDFESQEPTDDNTGADYEVTASATGTVHWRCVTADNLDEENKSRQHWRIAEGANVFQAFRYLRQLHVAVGQAAYVHQVWSNAAQDYTKHYSYVRKQLPAPVDKGGPADE